MSKQLDLTRLLALNWIVERAEAGDERVLRIAREKAAEGNRFAKDLLEKVGGAKGVGGKE